jgi:hypothetical protein
MKQRTPMLYTILVSMPVPRHAAVALRLSQDFGENCMFAQNCCREVGRVMARQGRICLLIVTAQYVLDEQDSSMPIEIGTRRGSTAMDVLQGAPRTLRWK